MGFPKAVSLACLYSAHFFFRAATMRRTAATLSILRLGICICRNIIAEEERVILCSVRYLGEREIPGGVVGKRQGKVR